MRRKLKTCFSRRKCLLHFPAAQRRVLQGQFLGKGQKHRRGANFIPFLHPSHGMVVVPRRVKRIANAHCHRANVPLARRAWPTRFHLPYFATENGQSLAKRGHSSNGQAAGSSSSSNLFPMETVACQITPWIDSTPRCMAFRPAFR